MIKLVLTCFLFSVCTDYVAPAQPGIAVWPAQIVWDCYGHPDKPVPHVYLVEAPFLTCANETGYMATGGGYGYTCVQGMTYSPTEIQVAYYGQKWSLSSLAHEELHAVQMIEGTLDLVHLGPDWQPGGRLDKANQKLIEAGY